MSSPANSSLRPAWHRGSQGGGRGFQPPPTVASERSRSAEPKQSNFNKFAALDDDEDVVAMEKQAEEAAARLSNSRSEALRTTSRTMSSGSTSGRGRSLADLAARAPPARERSASYGSSGERSGGGGSRLSGYVSSSNADDANVIRYTREKLLSLRPQPSSEAPQELREAVEGTVVLSEVAQDPVCWDNFDADGIWATVRRASTKAPEGLEARRSSSRREIGSSSGRWQRGVALPPPDQAKKSRDAENPSDLWDDPVAAEAATDFSAFGEMPAEEEPFDFEKMAEATRKFEEELHGGRSRASSEANSDDLENAQTMKVDPKRPLASVGTTIQSGSGDNVNVFEDFDDPGAEPEAEKPDAAIKGGDEDPSASSRLMAMIGVKKPEPAAEPEAIPAAAAATTNAWGAPEPAPKEAEKASVPLNPWGGPLLPGQGEAKAAFDLQARLREADQKAREAEIARRQQEQEEAQRRAAAQQQAEEQARQAANLQAQQAGVQSQVELVLMERISTILENSWGQSDLVSILSTLHSEDSRVIPLLNNVEALRALILRNPRRVALRSNPVFGTDMASLLMTNAQWQQELAAKQQAEAHARSQQELQRREQQQQREREEQQRQMLEQQRASAAKEISVVDGAPWYYSDPQNNIQGPFRGEEMRQWLEAGYFKSDLPISQKQTGPFLPLSALFPDLSVAFVTARDRSAEEAREKARLEAERAEAAAKEAAELQARETAERGRQAREAAERERRAQKEAEQKAKEEAAAAATKASKDNEVANESSAQLKMMLGLGAKSGSETAEAQSAKTTEKRASKAANKSNQQKVKESSLDAETPASQARAAASSPAWGGASQPVARKSMSEIQKEEARAAAILAMQRERVPSSSSGWANVAAARGGSSAWAPGEAKQRPAVVVQKQAVPAVQTRVTQSQAAKVAANNAQMKSQVQRSKSASSNVAEEFGAKMSPALEKWCRDQMQKLNGTDDLTLVSFCMTLDDPDEIRQYLTTYLGSTAQVNNFATEFINKKGGAKVQEEWETTAHVKKARKKKSGVAKS